MLLIYFKFVERFSLNSTSFFQVSTVDYFVGKITFAHTQQGPACWVCEQLRTELWGQFAHTGLGRWSQPPQKWPLLRTQSACQKTPLLRTSNNTWEHPMYIHVALLHLCKHPVYFLLCSVMLNARAFIPSEQMLKHCLLYTSPSPRDRTRSRMPSSA